MEKVATKVVPDVFISSNGREYKLSRHVKIEEIFENGEWYLVLHERAKLFNLEENMDNYRDCVIRVDWLVRSFADGKDYCYPEFYYNCNLVRTTFELGADSEPGTTIYTFKCPNKTNRILY